MPYIKPDKRPFYDDLIKKIVSKLEPLPPAQIEVTDLDRNEWVAEFTMNFLTEPEDQQDGQFNYFLTKLFIELHWLTEGTSYFCYRRTEKIMFPVIRSILEVYNQPNPSYFKYNRAMGMLFCCMKEFKRRYSNKAVLPLLFLEMIVKSLYEEIGDYENKKIQENGDVR